MTKGPYEAMNGLWMEACDYKTKNKKVKEQEARTKYAETHAL